MLFEPEQNKLKVFKCQNCRQYTTLDGDLCRYCKTPVDRNASAAAAAQEEAELKRTLRLKNWNQMTTGLVVFILGLAATIITFVLSVKHGGTFVVTWGAILFGGGSFIDGLVGWLQNKV